VSELENFRTAKKVFSAVKVCATVATVVSTGGLAGAGLLANWLFDTIVDEAMENGAFGLLDLAIENIDGTLVYEIGGKCVSELEAEKYVGKQFTWIMSSAVSASLSAGQFAASGETNITNKMYTSENNQVSSNLKTLIDDKPMSKKDRDSAYFILSKLGKIENQEFREAGLIWFKEGFSESKRILLKLRGNDWYQRCQVALEDHEIDIFKESPLHLAPAPPGKP
jgi:hypothetical protein